MLKYNYKVTDNGRMYLKDYAKNFFYEGQDFGDIYYGVLKTLIFLNRDSSIEDIMKHYKGEYHKLSADEWAYDEFDSALVNLVEYRYVEQVISPDNFSGEKVDVSDELLSMKDLRDIVNYSRGKR